MQTLDFSSFTGRYVDTYSTDYKMFFDLIHSALPPIKEYGWLAGGSLRRLLTREPLNSDFDFFFKSESLLEEFYENIKKSGDIRIIKEVDNELNKTIECIVCYTYIVKIQLVRLKYYNNVSDLLNSFDYTLCQLAYDSVNLYCGDSTLFDIGNRKLEINILTHPMSSLKRVFKYAKQGYTISETNLFKIIESFGGNPTKYSSNYY